ncbi:MAG: hypothetical protein M3373_12515 [Gemmatimonadota bacterium]|nr:hypothetical protein [Gemmatimonadota bacterium]
MSQLLASGWTAAAHLVVSALIVLWNIVVAGRIARWRDAPRTIAALSALAGLVIAPAILITVVSSSLLLGRSLHAIGWVWPLTAALICTQAIVALARGLVPPIAGATIAVYDVLVTVIAAAKYTIFLGLAVPAPLADIVAAHASALALGAPPEAALLPVYLHVPLLAPAVPARRIRLALAVRASLAGLAAVWTALVLIALPGARAGARGYARFAGEPLQERPLADIAIGLRLFPTVSGGGPPPLALESDLALAKQVDARVLSVHIAPGQATAALLDSLARVLEEPRRGGARLVAALAVQDGVPLFGAPPDEAYFTARLDEVERIVRRLRPDYLVPAVPRAGARRRVTLERWASYQEAAAARAHLIRPRTRVLAHLAGYGARDSAMYAAATGSSSALDGVGLRFFPSARGALSLDARHAAAERWMRAHPSRKEHWVLEAGGLPMAHGERSQELAVWHAIAWATRQPTVRGVIVHQASDYDAPVGLRAASGRLRPAVSAVERAIRALGEAAAPSP